VISGQPTLPFAPTLEDSEPRVNLVYSREDFTHIPLPEHAAEYPELRYMGSKHRLLPWIHGVLRGLDFDTAADPFVGSGCVAYLLKAMGKSVIASDFLNFPAVLAAATIANSRHRLDSAALKSLLATRRNGPHFIEQTFDRIFYTPGDLRFLDRVSGNIEKLDYPHQRALARSALMRSCLKKQPRGVFTVSGDLSRYDDGRRDLRLSIEEHFLHRWKRSIGLCLTMDGGIRLSMLTCLASNLRASTSSI
jgi:DNA adenine methylase/adenine-specific DNA-methyltransferase